jgi:hypothetical protein
MEHLFDPDPNSLTSPSFPHAFSGNPGGIGTGPPIKTFGGDVLGIAILYSVQERLSTLNFEPNFLT